MKALIIGFGSIGRRHFEVLSKIKQIKFISIVSKQKNLKNKTYRLLEEVDNIKKYDYFVIASETNKHYEQLKYLENNVKNKLIFLLIKKLVSRNKQYDQYE